MEIWKEIQNLNGKYLISNYGNVKSLYTNRILKSGNNNGYQIVNLHRKNYYVHRLVAIHFLENIENKNQVNHIDFNKSNNHINNLEWITAKENTLHYWANNKTCNKNYSKKYSTVNDNLRGINFYKRYNKWVYRIYINGKQKSLGYFNTVEEALQFKNNYLTTFFI